MEDMKRAKYMERVLRDMQGEGQSLATLAKRYNLSEESIIAVLGTRPEEKESSSKPIRVSIWKRLGV
jgi:Mor family transcriptional regulator